MHTCVVVQVRPIAAGPPGGSTLHVAWRWIRAAAPSSWPTLTTPTRCVGCPPAEVRTTRARMTGGRGNGKTGAQGRREIEIDTVQHDRGKLA